MNSQKMENNYFPYFGMLGLQKHFNVGRILKKSLQGSIHAQFYMTIRGIFDLSVAAVYSEHKATQKQVLYSQLDPHIMWYLFVMRHDLLIVCMKKCV